MWHSHMALCLHIISQHDLSTSLKQMCQLATQNAKDYVCVYSVYIKVYIYVSS